MKVSHLKRLLAELPIDWEEFDILLRAPDGTHFQPTESVVRTRSTRGEAEVNFMVWLIDSNADPL